MNQKNKDSRKQIGFYCMEDLVPRDHILRKIEKAIDFSLIHDLVKDEVYHTARQSQSYNAGFATFACMN